MGKEKRGGEYIPVSYEVLGHDVEAIGTMLLELVDDERRVAIIGEGSYEWIASYLAVMNAGLVVVPIDKELGWRRDKEPPRCVKLPYGHLFI